jgi:hypothetical protein
VPLPSLDEALLVDLLDAYADPAGPARPQECGSTDAAATTTFSFDWPGPNAASAWSATHTADFEEALFRASMTHADANGNSWTVRIGTGGNMYSHYAPDRHGEAMPPQDHTDAPWIDEVQQCVAVNENLNGAASHGGRPYYVHQAGAYQQDRPDTGTPFYSPSLAHHCADNWCAFAGWGTQAHVPTPFTSPIMYFNKYTNCGNGVIEHVQMIHK